MSLESNIDLIAPFLTVADMKSAVQLNKYISSKIQPELYERGVVPWEHRGKFCGVIFNNDLADIPCESIDLSELPHLKYLDICGKHIKGLPDFSVQTNLKKLYIDGNFNQYIDFSGQTKLKTLFIGNYFNQPLNLSNNIHLDFLCIGHKFNQPLDLSVQTKLKTLYIGECFNQPLDLSNNICLKSLSIGKRFNQPLDLSSNIYLKNLTICGEFNYPLNLSAQRQLNSLTLGGMIDQMPNLSAQTNLMYIRLVDCSFNQPIDLSFLLNLETIEIITTYAITPNIKINALIQLSLKKISVNGVSFLLNNDLFFAGKN